MLIQEEMQEIFATTVQAELNASLHVCESGCKLSGEGREERTCFLREAKGCYLSPGQVLTTGRRVFPTSRKPRNALLRSREKK